MVLESSKMLCLLSEFNDVTSFIHKLTDALRRLQRPRSGARANKFCPQIRSRVGKEGYGL
jgi:hypothetical protein